MNLEGCRARAAAIAPGRTCAIAADVPDADILCISGAETPNGRELVARYPEEATEPLHAMLTRVHPQLGRLFQPTGIFHHVGGRPCTHRVRGSSVGYWMRSELVTPSLRIDRWLRPVAGALASVCGIGLLPAIGANAASLVTCLAVWLLASNGDAALTAMALGILATVLSILIERAAARHFLSDDAREFVLDEVAGMAIALAFLPASPGFPSYLIAFAAFRVFDIIKPGIKWVEKLPIPGKVAWDDVLAGLYAGIVVLITARFFA